ncbi:TRAP transporter substrate-binding protein DctP [Tabrizicola sp.]|uniref:TRAP transporter substrate-binding protein DctP n=1 Tax=Tabrizicola sp. TaxID=2005166 RepID=UPI003F3FC173
MTSLFKNLDCSIKLALLVSAAVLTMTTSVGAQQVTLVLKADNGRTKITGSLVEFKDNFYVIESALGLLNVAADMVDCLGAACSSVVTEPVVWNVSLWGERRAITEHVEKLAELVDQKTDGDFKLNLAYGASLAPAEENLDGILAGSFEMAQFCAGYDPEKNPTLNVLELPFLGVSSLEEEIAISFAVYQHPATKADMARWNATLLMPSPQPQQNIMGVGQPPTSLVDFKGMTIRATGGIGDAVAALGAVPVSLPAPDTAEAMKSGEVRAVSFAPHAHMSFGTIEDATWWTTNLNPGAANCPIVVNTSALEDLPESYREALLSSVDAALDHYVENYNEKTMAAWYPALRERGIIELTFDDKIISAIDEAVAEPAAAAWIDETSRQGLPAEELYGLVMTTLGN